jgi:SAM-dependent methyltransferase
MSIDVVDLRNFYGQRLGVVARRFIGRSVRALWGDTAGQRVLGVGYATPYLGLFREEAERCLAFMPAAQGVVKWPSARPSLTSLVEELDLPLTDAAVDRAMLVHALEMSRDAEALLREVWRVLAPGGRLLVVDMMPHDREAYRQQMGHVWLGFSEAEMARYLATAGFDRPCFRPLPPDPSAPSAALLTSSMECP